VSSDVLGVPERYRNVFRSATFWSEASDEVLDRLSEASTVHECRRGEVIYREGSRADRVIVVLAGYVRGVHYQPTGHVVLLENSGPGEVLGPIGAFADTPFEADLEAGADTVIAAFPISLLEEIIESDSTVAMSVIRGMARRWVSVVGVTKRNAAEVPTRLARYLFSLPALNSSSTSLLVELPCSRVELAVMLATTPETLSRTFHRLADEHILEAYERTVRVLNVPELERIAAGETPE
jgi:CRP/FNR family transcriptional regulator, dissimilatory nitrate respiration regulator